MKRMKSTKCVQERVNEWALARIAYCWWDCRTSLITRFSLFFPVLPANNEIWFYLRANRAYSVWMSHFLFETWNSMRKSNQTNLFDASVFNAHFNGNYLQIIISAFSFVLGAKRHLLPIRFSSAVCLLPLPMPDECMSKEFKLLLQWTEDSMNKKNNWVVCWVLKMAIRMH